MSVSEHARSELERARFEDSDVMMEIIEKFLDTWDSGAAAMVALDAFTRLIRFKPLTELTGESSEWICHDEMGPARVWQNVRCSTVFKDQVDGPAYDIESGQRVPVTFPYYP